MTKLEKIEEINSRLESTHRKLESLAHGETGILAAKLSDAIVKLERTIEDLDDALVISNTLLWRKI